MVIDESEGCKFCEFLICFVVQVGLVKGFRAPDMK